MAKISKKKLIVARDQILHGGSYLQKEAYALQVTVDELAAEFEAMYEGGKKNTQYKAVMSNSKKNSSRVPQEELNALRITPKQKNRAVSKTTNAKSTSATTESATPLSSEGHVESTDLLECLLKKKESLEKEISGAELVLREATDILQIRKETFLMAKEVVKKAEEALNAAEVDYKNAINCVTQAEADVNDVRTAMEKVEAEVEKTKSKLYLVSPWYSGELPKYGTLISTEEMERCVTQDVPSEYMPEMEVSGILLFDYVPDYKKARVFVGLVTMYEMLGKEYTLLVDDERVMQLIKQSI